MLIQKKELNRDNIGLLPDISDFTKVLIFIHNTEVNCNYFNNLNEISALSNEMQSSLLNISVKTLRECRKPGNKANIKIIEHLVFLLSLYEHGVDVFDSKENFNKWLFTYHFFLDNKPPVDFLNTIAGITFIDDRLTSIEYGDNI